MDDPIFDPWSSEPDLGDTETPGETDADPSPDSPRSRGRWQSPGARTPLERPKPVGQGSPPTASDPAERQQEAELDTQPTDVQPDTGPVDVDRRTQKTEGPTTRAVELEASSDESGEATPAPAVVTVEASGLSGQLRETVFPRVEWLSSRLRIAGHDTVIDDRLGAVVPSLRLRLAPRRYPLAEDGHDASAVLEVTANERRAEVAARLWLDPMATGPTEDVRIHAAQLSDAWIDRLLLEFVERTLEDA